MFTNYMQAQVRLLAHADAAHHRTEADVETVEAQKNGVLIWLTNLPNVSLFTMAWWPWGKLATANTGAPSGDGEDAASSACPVDHATREKFLEQKCPVNHNAQKAYLDMAKHSMSATTSPRSETLSEEREVSSIPRFFTNNGADYTMESGHAPAEMAMREENEKHWVYPSPRQFYTAIRRKNYDARAEDMDMVVPIHNAVNEEAWRRIVDWESSWSTDKNAPGPQLVNFVGRPRDTTWRAWFRGLAGYEKPFDRHDWVIVRPRADDQAPKTMRYVIDFYTGRADKKNASQPVSFYLDVRPAPSSFEGIAMRINKWWQDMKL